MSRRNPLCLPNSLEAISEVAAAGFHPSVNGRKIFLGSETRTLIPERALAALQKGRGPEALQLISGWPNKGPEARLVTSLPNLGQVVAADFETTVRDEWYESAVSAGKASWGEKGKRRTRVRQVLGGDPKSDEDFVAVSGFALNGRTGRPRVLSVSQPGSMVGYVIDLNQADIGRVADWLASRTVVWHNSVFDLQFAYAGLGVSLRDTHDTMLQANALGWCWAPWSTLRSDGARVWTGMISLKLLAKAVLGWDLEKDEGIRIHWRKPGLSDRQVRYAGLDAVATAEVFARLDGLIDDRGLRPLYDNLRGAAYATSRLVHDGMPISEPAVLSEVRRLESEHRAHREAILSEHGFDIDSGMKSTKVFTEWARTHLPEVDIEWWEANGSTKTGFSYGKPMRNAVNYAEKTGQYAPHLAIALSAAAGQTSLIARLRADLLGSRCPASGRLHSSYHLGGAVTGRFRSTSPNLQNLPRSESIRACVAADVLVGGDLGQAEVRASACASGDEEMLRVLFEGQDIHSYMAAKILKTRGIDVEPGAVRGQYPEVRVGAKSALFGTVYGISDEGLSGAAAVTKEEARGLIDAVFSMFPSLHVWYEAQRRAVYLEPVVSTPLGRRVNLVTDLGVPDYKLKTTCLNTPIQGGVAEVCNSAMHLLTAGLLEAGLLHRVKFSGFIHDEFLIECRKGDAKQVAKILNSAMVRGFQSIYPRVPTTNLAEIKTGPTWADLKEN